MEKRVCVLGGSGFIGRHLVGLLQHEGYRVRVPTRRRQRSRHLLVNPAVELVEGDLFSDGVLDRLFEGVDAVINLVGILNESGPAGEGFRRAHVTLTELALAACRRAGVPCYLHMSALGADVDGPSLYQRTKGEAERLALAANDGQLAVTVFRPSVVFGPEDSFLNRFAALLRLAPGVFPLPSARTRFQPVYVGDVAQAFLRALQDDRLAGQSLDLVGPNRYTLLELVRLVADWSGSRCRVIPAPDALARLQARVLGLLPGKPFSMDNYLSATVDSISDHNALPELGIHPTAVEAVAPGHLSGGRTARYDGHRRHAGR